MSSPQPADAAEQALRSDPRFVSGIEKLDHARLEQLSIQLERNLAIGITFNNHLEDATQAKARAGRADPQAESRLVQIGNQAVAAGKDAVRAMGEVGTLLAESGLEEPLNEHLPVIFKNYDDNATIQSQLTRYRSLGARDESLQCVRDELAKEDFNALRLQGADGTIGGLIRSAQTTELQSFVGIIERRGLPTIMGRGAAAGFFIILAFVIAAIIAAAIEWSHH